jgi:hypothetical protein
VSQEASRQSPGKREAGAAGCGKAPASDARDWGGAMEVRPPPELAGVGHVCASGIQR